MDDYKWSAYKLHRDSHIYILKLNQLWNFKAFNMITFDTVRICRKMMGILPLNSNRREWTLNTILKTLWITDITVHCLSTLWFSLFDAETFTEFVQSFFNVLHSSLLLTWFSIYYLQRNAYASYIDQLETEIEKSKYTAIGYTEIGIYHRDINQWICGRFHIYPCFLFLCRVFESNYRCDLQTHR